jgi:putative ABC transport system permease protein
MTGRMDTLRQDVMYALRRLARAPGFTLVVIATLALGLGANTAIFSVINAVLLKPLPYDHPDRLVLVSQTWEGKATVYSPPNFLDLAAQAQAFESLAAIQGLEMTLAGRGAPVRLDGAGVSASFFDVLRIRPIEGRVFREGENEPGKARVAVLGHALWSGRFGADPGAVGQTIQLNHEPYLVVGVAPPGFSYPRGAEVWTPLEYDSAFRTKARGAWYLTVVGRLMPDVPLERARREVSTIATRLAKAYPEMDEGVGGTVVSLHEAIVGGSRPALLVLLAAVGLVLLIACVNVANLVFARVIARRAELAVRTALGAGRSRLVRQLLTESLLLGLLGGGGGILLASLSLDTLLGLQPAGVPRLGEVRIDHAVLGFAVALSLLTGLLFGLLPALQMTRGAAATVLREGGRGVRSARDPRIGASLVIGQMALAMILLTGAGLLIRSFGQLRRVDPGFRSDSALTFRISLPEMAYVEESQRTSFFDTLLSRLAALPGVRSTGAVLGLPLGETRFSFTFAVAGRLPLPPQKQPSMEARVATTGYFNAMGIPLLRGRGFGPDDTSRSRPVVVLSESAVRRFFPGEDPLGKRITLGWRHGEGHAGGEVIGVVGDVNDFGLSEERPPEIYLPYEQLPIESLDVVLRTSVPPRSLAPSAEAVVRELDPDLPLTRVQTLDDIVARSISAPRFYMVLLGLFAGMALLLASLGIYGVMSYAVAQRSREIAIRVALGAPRGSLLRMILGDALVLVFAGVATGLAGALALSRTLATLLFNLSPADPTTLAGMAILLSLVALLASYVPARRATRVDPLVALRSQ